MFYSQTFLARKGPLGTVWCAAHLQHRLKKSHYTSTNIPSTVDRIMFPEVPIALRMSGHLLLGVVRIYSKKVDYLYHDCNVILIGLRKAFSTVNVNLPEDATHAPVHTVTLPQKFDLDAVDLDDHILDDGYDKHHRSEEDITLTDQIPVGRDIYVAITFDEDIMMDLTCPGEVPDSGFRQMEYILPEPPSDAIVGFQEPEHELGMSNQTEGLNVPVDVQDLGPSNERELPAETEVFQDAGASNQRELPTQTEGFQDPGASNQTEVLGGTLELQETGPSYQMDVPNPKPTDDTSQNFPEIEVMRDANHDFSAGNLLPLFPDIGNDGTEPIGSLDQFLNEKETETPTWEDLLASGGQSLQFQQHSEPPASAFPQEAPEVFDTRISLGHSSPALAIRSTPPQVQKRRKRKRNLFDETIVLPNRLMNKALEDSSDLLRKKRNMPSSALDVWKFNNRARKEQIFCDPLLTGLCEDISNILKKDYISTKPHLAATEPMIVDSPAPETEVIPEPSPVQYPTHATDTNWLPSAVQSPTHATETIPESSAVQSPTHATETISVLGAIRSPTCATQTIPVLMSETVQEPGLAESYVPVPEDTEIEQLRHDESNIGNDNLPEFMPSTARDVQSPFRRKDLTSFSSHSLGTTFGSAALPTPDVAASTGTNELELETPRTLSVERLGLQSTGLYSIPELINSTEAEDLSFLEADDNTPTGSQASQGVESLSIRTRAVVQYLKRRSPITPILECPSDHLSVNKILEGKTRKLCARMFFETLVLKSYGLIDVQQEQPYGDISLKLTPTLSKANI